MKCIVLSVASFLALMALCLAQVASAQCGDSGCGAKKKVDVMCGPKCLLLISQKFGIRANLDELAKLSGKDEKGTTLAGLYKAVEKKGLYAVGMKIGIDDLGRLDVPAIAHLWGNHFVVVENSADGLKVTDPSKTVKDPEKEDQSMPLEKFKARYSGFALLISKDKDLFPKVEASGPDLRLGSYFCNLGFADEGAKIERTVKVRNAGNMHLGISKVRSSCGCMTAEISDKMIPPGGVGEIKLAFDTKGLSGGQTKELYIQSNDPASPLVQLEVGVGVKPNKVLVSARSINLGEINIHGGAEREIYVKDPGDGSLKVEKVESDSPALTAAMTPRKSENKEHPGYQVALNLKPGQPIGEFKSNVTIYTNHPKEPKVEIPVTAVIKGDVEAFPKTFFLGMLKKGEGAAKSITISTTGKDPFIIDKVDSPFDYVSVEVTPKVEGKEYTVTATLKETAPVGNIKGDVVIHTSNPDQPEIKVPLYALIEDK